MSGSPVSDSIKGILRDLVNFVSSLKSLCGLHGFGIYTLHPSKPAAAASLATDQGCPVCCMMVVQVEETGGYWSSSSSCLVLVLMMAWSTLDVKVAWILLYTAVANLVCAALQLIQSSPIVSIHQECPRRPLWLSLLTLFTSMRTVAAGHLNGYSNCTA